jgi:sterol carrier protein 2
MGLEAATRALLDAGITYDEVQAAFVGYCYGAVFHSCMSLG